MAKIEPAIAHIACAWAECDAVIDIEITPTILFHGDWPETYLRVRVDQNGVNAQPLWDHVLEHHGPKIEP